MDLKRKLALVTAILAVALGAGQLMQTVLKRPAAHVAVETTPKAIEHLAAGPEAAPLKTAIVAPLPQLAKPPAPQATYAALVPGLPKITWPAKAPDLSALTQTDAALTEVTPDCTAKLDLSLQPKAMLGLVLTAPCHAGERVVLRHAGLAVTAKTSATGSLLASLPAMKTAAQVSVLFADSSTADATIIAPGVAGLRRFGVQWMADDAFQVHAFENDATYGEPGHVSASAPGAVLAGLPSDGGYLTVLGDSSVALPMRAEIYTYPAQAKAAIVVETTVTAATCGRELLAETLASFGGGVTVTDLTVAMPDCQAIGDFLVLNNLAADPKIAAAN